jgi:type I restriction enzyme S subunit
MRTYKLKELLSIKNGKDHKELNDGNIPIFGSGGIMRFGDRAIYNDESILLPRKGTLSNIQYVNKPFWTVDTIYYSIINKALASPFYLFNYIKSLDLSKLNSGTGVPSMTFDSYYNLDILLPELETQQKVASVLSALDSKIELNNRINVELEAMAKTLYDYWFVQFDFPDKNGKPYKTSGGKMVWNEELKREIPEGWEVQKMAEWLDIDKSGDWGKEEAGGNFTKQVICFRGADINGLNGLDELKPPVRWILEKNSFKILKSHDLIIEISGGSPTQSTGRLAFITDATIKRFEHPLICSNFCKPVSMRNKKLLYNFVYYWNSLYDNGIFFGYEGKTSGIKNLLLDSFISSYYTVVPDEMIVDQFYDIMDNIQEKKQTALAENQKLTDLRDWLLPMLMNGQVKVMDEKETELSMAAEPKMKYGK